MFKTIKALLKRKFSDKELTKEELLKKYPDMREIVEVMNSPFDWEKYDKYIPHAFAEKVGILLRGDEEEYAEYVGKNKKLYSLSEVEAAIRKAIDQMGGTMILSKKYSSCPSVEISLILQMLEGGNKKSEESSIEDECEILNNKKGVK